MTLMLDNVRQSIANFSNIYTLSLLQEKREIEKEGKKEEIRKETREMKLLHRFFFCQVDVNFMSSLETISFRKHTQSFTQESYVMIYRALTSLMRRWMSPVDP